METVSCNLCHNNTFHPVYQVLDTNYGTPGHFTLVKCTTCGLIFMNPRPTKTEIGDYYPSHQYHPFRVIQQNQHPKPNAMHQKRAENISQAKNYPQEQTILDVGCGNGLFLLAMKAKGWHVYGVEPDELASDFARNTLNLVVNRGDIFSTPKGVLFDVITFWDVLEHTHFPQDVLLQAHSLLKDNGLLAINVPNWASWERQIFREKWIALDAPRHLYHFSPTTLKMMLESCNFEVSAIRSQSPTMSPASNILRALGNRKQGCKQTNEKTNSTTSAPAPSFTKKFLIRLTYAALFVPNKIANTAGHGGSITVYCKKKASI